MKTKDQFSADMSQVFSLVKDSCGSDTIQNDLFSYFDGDIDVSADNEEDCIESFTYTDMGMLAVLYDLVNYDMVSLQDKTINVEASNHPDIATIIKKYAKPETIEKVYNRFYE